MPKLDEVIGPDFWATQPSLSLLISVNEHKAPEVGERCFVSGTEHGATILAVNDDTVDVRIKLRR